MNFSKGDECILDERETSSEAFIGDSEERATDLQPVEHPATSSSVLTTLATFSDSDASLNIKIDENVCLDRKLQTDLMLQKRNCKLEVMHCAINKLLLCQNKFNIIY